MLKRIQKHRIVSIVSGAAVLFTLGGFFWAYFALRAVGSGPFILHFNDIDGITQVGGLSSLVFMGFFGLVVTLMNFAIALELEEKDGFLGKITAVATLGFAILLFIAFAAILNVN